MSKKNNENMVMAKNMTRKKKKMHIKKKIRNTKEPKRKRLAR